MTENLLGTRIGHFRIVDMIAAGGMGEVSRAPDVVVDTTSAASLVSAGAPRAVTTTPDLCRPKREQSPDGRAESFRPSPCLWTGSAQPSR